MGTGGPVHTECHQDMGRSATGPDLLRADLPVGSAEGMMLQAAGPAERLRWAPHPLVAGDDALLSGSFFLVVGLLVLRVSVWIHKTRPGPKRSNTM